jgi:hypothetical protein
LVPINDEQAAGVFQVLADGGSDFRLPGPRLTASKIGSRSIDRLARFPFGWNHPNVKKSRQINNS